MKKLSTALFVLVLFPLFLFSQPKEITLEKIWQEMYFSPQTITLGKSMQDGLRYSLVENNTDINIYKYETGEFQETVFSTRDLLKGENGEALSVDYYSFSPDESMLLVGANQESIYRRSTRAEHYIWNIESQELTPLSEGTTQRLPDFSPDGKKIAFVRANNIYIKNLSSGEEYPVTTDGEYNKIINGTTDWVYEEEFAFVKGFHWSPDGAKIAFYRFDEEHVKEFLMLLYGELYPEEYRFKYPKAGEENAFVTIHIYDVESGETLQVDIGEEKDQYIPRIQWTRDPEKLSIQRLNRHQNQLEILLAEAATGSTSLLYLENNLYYIDITDDLTFLENGRNFIISSEKSGYNHLYLYDMQGREVRALTSGSWDVQRFLGVDEDKGLVYYLSHEESPLTNNLYSVRLNGRRKTRITQEEGMHNPTFSEGFQFFINQYSTISSPPVFSLHHANGRKISILEDNEELVEKTKAHGFVEPEFFQFTTGDDVELNGWMIKPADFNPEKEYPVLMYVYGGPGSQTVIERWNPFNGVWFQMLARKGFIVVSVDNRGTGARGEEFKKMTYLELGKYETIDQIEAAKYLASLDFVDAGRIGIFGWSYGGYLTSLCLAKGADWFNAAIAVAPVTHWRFYDTIYTERYMRTPQENPDGYEDNSPINHVDKIRGNYLLVHGSADDNVHYQHTMEMAEALIEANVDFELMIYPNHDHSIFSRNARFHLYRLMTDFLQRSLQ